MENTVEIGGTTYVLKMFPTMTGLGLISKLEKNGFTDEVILEVITKGASLGSVSIDRKKFDDHFRGKYKDVMELFAAVLKYNNLFPEAEDGEEGNESGSEE